MADNGIRSDNLPVSTSPVEILGHDFVGSERRMVRVPVSALPSGGGGGSGDVGEFVEAVAALQSRFADTDALHVEAGSRPGEAPVLFTHSLSGAAKDLPPIAEGTSVATVDGVVLRVVATGGDPLIIAARKDDPAEAGLTYSARIAVRRFQNTSDPLGDTVQYGIACLNAVKQKVSERIFFEGSLAVADGLVSRQVTFSRDQEAEFTLSETTRYVRPFVRVFGGNGTTDIVTIGSGSSFGLPGAKGDTGDVTPAAQALRDESLVLTKNAADLNAVTLANANTTNQRLNSIEVSQTSGPTLVRATYAGLSALTPPLVGQGAQVLETDTGTHTDPVLGGTVPNAGFYSYSLSPAGWQWIGATASVLTPTSVKNLYDPALASAGTLNAATGAIGASGTFTTSGHIPVVPGIAYARSGASARVNAFYDSAREFISSVTGNTFKTPSSAAFLRVTFSNTELPTAMVAAGNLAGPYVPFTSVREIRDFRPTAAQTTKSLQDASVLTPTNRVRTNRQEDMVREVYNLFDNRRVIAGVRLSNAIVTTAAGNNISELISVLPSTLYTMNIAGVGCAEYDPDGVYIGNLVVSGSPNVYTFTTTASTAFVRLSVADSSLATTMLVQGANFPNGNVYVPYNLFYLSGSVLERRRKYEGKRIAWLGDSMSNPVHAASNTFALEMGFYNQPFRDNTDFNPGYAISGRSLARRPTITGNDSQGNPYSQNSLVQIFSTVDANRDACFIYIGANDFGEPGGSTFGTMASRDDSSFYGALHLVCQAAIDKFPLKPIRFFTPTPRKRSLGGGNFAEQDQPNDVGKTLFDYVDAMQEVCAFYSIPCRDQLRASFLHPKSAVNFATYYPDGGGVHLSPAAHALLAKSMIEWEKGLGE